MRAFLAGLFVWVLLSPLVFAGGGSRVAPLFTSRMAVQARVDTLLQENIRDVNLLTYKFRPDRVGLAYMALLREAARSGAYVRFAYDPLVSKMPPALLALLSHEKNMEIKEYRPVRLDASALLHPLQTIKALNERMHLKILTINNQEAIIGSSNITEQYPLTLRRRRPKVRDKQFRDKDIYVQGEVVEAANEFINDLWGSKNLVRPRLPRHINSSLREEMDRLDAELDKMLDESYQLFGTKAWQLDEIDVPEIYFVADKLANNKPGKIANTHKKVIELIRSSKKSISIESPYVILNEEIYEELRKASKRGVEIKIFTVHPRRSDVKAAGELFSHDLPLLAKLGASVFVYDGFTIPHGKVISVDSHVTFLGSYNLDQRSPKYNSEMGMIISSREFAKSFENDFSQSLKYSTQIVGSGRVFWKKIFKANKSSCANFLLEKGLSTQVPVDPGGNLNFYMQFIRRFY